MVSHRLDGEENAEETLGLLVHQASPDQNAAEQDHEDAEGSSLDPGPVSKVACGVTGRADPQPVAPVFGATRRSRPLRRPRRGPDGRAVSPRQDGRQGRIVVVGTVNAIGQLDPALLRPGRFDEVHEIPEPDADYRRLVVKHYTKKFAASVNIDSVTERTDGFSPADVRELLLSVGTVGPQVLDVELERVRRQRGLFANDACANYLSNRSNRPGTLDPLDPKE